VITWVVRGIAMTAVAVSMAAAVSGASQPAAAAAPATTASVTSASRHLFWRIAYEPHIRNGVMTGVTAPASDAVWAIGRVYPKHGTGPYFLLHWNGKHWRKSGMPAHGYRADTVMASSARNVWMFGWTGKTPLALRWNGHHWLRIAEPSEAQFGLQSEAVFSATDVWVANGAYAARWTGSRWIQVPLPVPVQQLSGSSPRDVWVAGIEAGGKLAAYRYENRKWHPVPMPHPAATFAGLVVQSATSVFVTAITTTSQPLLHWNGHRWHRLTRRVGYIPIPMAAYGRDGVWVNPGTVWTGRSWALVGGPGDIGAVLPEGLASVPRSTSAWLVANASPGAVVLRAR